MNLSIEFDATMKVRVRVPATTANLGPGFDCLGLALNLHNTVEIEETDAGPQIQVSGEGVGLVETDATNLVYRAAHALFRHAGASSPSGLRIRLHNKIPLMSGLGSSSAAIVGGLVAANALLDEPLNQDEILTLAVDLEGHPDNVAPALLGGLVVVIDVGGTPVYRRITIPALEAIVVVPDYRLATVEARAALPAQVPLADAVYNLGRTALVVQGLVDADYELLAHAMDDRLHQPYRTPLVPGLADVFAAAKQAGAAGVALSGAGPSVVAFAAANHDAVAAAMRAAFSRNGLDARTMCLKTVAEGAQIVAGEGWPAEDAAA